MISRGDSLESSAKGPGTEVCWSNLLRAIHAAAQPLTILRASLGKDQTDRMSLIKLRKLAAASAIEIERVCTYFDFLQRLVESESLKPQLSAVRIAPLVSYATEGFNLLFERDGMFLRSVVSERCQSALIDRVRTLHALSNVLLVAHGVSHKLDTVEVIASSPSPSAVRIIVRNTNSYAGAMNEESYLRMALAEANIRTQKATLSWSLEPFSVQIEFARRSKCTRVYAAQCGITGYRLRTQRRRRED